ncbi:MAG TPA: lipopolysaccharide heptosyltransferase II, partial [Pyrinomonadaceae bacterium]|nr:lipopolysaccharide heptosyltransferase II [Pyrinomonadaceae bacterium]
PGAGNVFVKELKAENIRRVVVRGANWVGDAVMTVPALRELRRVLPGAHLTLATRGWAEGVFAGADFLDELLLIESGGLRSHLRQIRGWRARRFDLALLFPNAFQPALVAFAARVPARLGYGTDGRRALLTHPLETPPWRKSRHEVFYYLNLVAELERLLNGSTSVETREPRPALPLSEERKSTARALLRRSGVDFMTAGLSSTDSPVSSPPLVALCPGSTNSRAKRWPVEHFAALADRLVEEMKATVLLVGSREESDVTRAVAARMRRSAVVLTGQTTLDETAAVLGLVDLLVTNDTGPAHLAAALGRPVLVIFGPTDPTTTRPFSPLAEVLRRPPECAPCMLRDCPIDHRCMTAITPAEVFARADAMLRARADATDDDAGLSVEPSSSPPVESFAGAEVER